MQSPKDFDSALSGWLFKEKEIYIQHNLSLVVEECTDIVRVLAKTDIGYIGGVEIDRKTGDVIARNIYSIASVRGNIFSDTGHAFENVPKHLLRERQ